jgi:photosystem II stability/assembly factor-like uncharacterized protein
MKKLLPCLALLGLFVLALGGTASAKPPTLASLAATVAGTTPNTAGPAWAAATDRISPTVTAITPAAGPNDIDTPVVISGTDFAAVMSGTVVLTSPTASLGSTALTNVIFVNSTTLTATVPWGMDPGAYALTVVNPDGGTATPLAGAFNVTQGIGQWNGGDLFGGQVSQILLKPGNPNTLYALAYGVGFFRSRDAGEHWTLISGEVANAVFAVDPLHPTWVYGSEWDGLCRSQDEGDTWTKLMSTWPDGRLIEQAEVYPSPHDPQVLFVRSAPVYLTPAARRGPSAVSPRASAVAAQGLIKSADGGVTWKIVADMEGVAIQDVAFDPADPLQMVLATQSGQVFRSIDGGDHWSEVSKPPVSTIAAIAYNPYRPTEVWIGSDKPGQMFKSTDAACTSWQDVTPPLGHFFNLSFITFTAADSVYTTRNHTTDGGLTWHVLDAVTARAGEIIFDPNNPLIGYFGDGIYGVEKTTDGGQTWAIKSQGLSGMNCDSLEVSRADPLRVYATFGGWPGIYRSTDGASNWTYVPLGESPNGPFIVNVRLVREDPFDPKGLYVASDSGFYVSTDGGESWTSRGWNGPTAQIDMPYALAADPNQRGHLLVGLNTSHTAGQVYVSSDYGVSWQPVTMPQDLSWITDMAFDPVTPGLVYLCTSTMASPGTGVYRSTDSGSTWTRIDDPQQPDMQSAADIAIATHPQHMLVVEGSGYAFRSLDDGTTWQKAQGSPGGVTGFTFAGGDSTRSYIATLFGLYSSSNAGDTWARAAGVLGGLHVMALGSAVGNGQTILYAATCGGATGASASPVAGRNQDAVSAASTLVDAGIYRYVLVSAPTISSFTPTSGPVGTVVTVTGTHFTGATAVAFHGTPVAKFSAASDTRITVTVPAGATSGAISVTTPGGSASSTTSFSVVVTPKVTLKLSGLKKGALKLGKRLTVTGKVTPATLAGSKVTLKVQKRKGHKWVALKTVKRTIGHSGAYSWKYKLAKRGSYRIQTSIAKTAMHAAATTKWLAFKVK